MSNIYTNSTDEHAAKSLLNDLLFVAGLRSTNQRTNGNIQFPTYLSNEALTVGTEVIKRAFNDVDKEIKKISGSYLSIPDHLTKRSASSRMWNGDEIATALVYLAECLNIYWDDLNATPYEVDAFKKTLLGNKVATFKRFTSDLQAQQNAAPIATSPVSQNSTNAGGRRSRSSGGGTPSGKPIGPQSANIRDLQGTPGNKLFAAGNEVYRIIGTNANSKNVPNAFIRPLNANGAAGSTNKVFFNSGNGYTDLTCWFDDLNDAQDFLAQLQAKYVLPSNMSNLRIARSAPDTNGYFLVGTEFGACGVRARSLNEAIRESVETADDLTEECEEENGWEKVGQRITNEDYEALRDSMLKY